MTDATEQIDGATNEGEDGEMLFQENKGCEKEGLKRNYLYLHTCTTEDQMVNPIF